MIESEDMKFQLDITRKIGNKNFVLIRMNLVVISFDKILTPVYEKFIFHHVCKKSFKLTFEIKDSHMRIKYWNHIVFLTVDIFRSDGRRRVEIRSRDSIEDPRVRLPGYVSLASASRDQFNGSRWFWAIVTEWDALFPRTSRIA